MTLWVVVPVRPLTEGKSRLAPVLDADARRRLNERFLLTTLDIATAVVGPARVLVVSRCADALALSRAAGVVTLRELGAGGLEACPGGLPKPSLKALDDHGLAGGLLQFRDMAPEGAQRGAQALVGLLGRPDRAGGTRRQRG